MHFHIITLFPSLFDSYFSDALLRRAIDKGLMSISFYNPRDFTQNKHRKVDDIPYGGGPGMVMTVQPIIDAWEEIRKKSFLEKVKLKKTRTFKTILLSPGGKKFTTAYAKETVHRYTDIIFISGRYEGIDARVAEITGAEEISIGDYVLTGGELPIMVMIDVMARQLDGVLGNKQSLEEERISAHKVYTRPAEYIHKKKKYSVPEVLLNGNHREIDAWRKEH